jgi:hypothetical protein
MKNIPCGSVVIASITIGILLQSCATQPRSLPAEMRARGSLIQSESLGIFDRQKLQLVTKELPGGLTADNPVELFRVIYWTVLQGAPTKASGLFVVPQGVAPKGLVMYFHGSNAERATAPSQAERIDGNTEAAVFSGNGYYSLLPDYIGLGASLEAHPFALVRPSVDAAVDLLRAVKTLTAQKQLAWAPSLFLMGFSQEGQVAAAVHRDLERTPMANLELKASVGVAGPYELRRSAVQSVLANGCLLCVGYVAWAVSAYGAYYGHALSDVLLPSYLELVPSLFDGSHSGRKIGQALPKSPPELLQPRFLQQLRGNEDSWFTKALDENETYAWAPKAPFRIYFGEQDTDVSIESSRLFYEYAKSHGGNISLTSLGAVDHQEAGSKAYAPAFQWFAEHR